MKLTDLANADGKEITKERTLANIEIVKNEFDVFIARVKSDIKKLETAGKNSVADFVRNLKSECGDCGECTPLFVHSLVDGEQELARLRTRLEILERKRKEFFED